MRIALLPTLCLLVALPAFADRVVPANPTSADLVTYYVAAHSSCPYEQNVIVDGFDITIELLDVGGGCTSVATEYPFALGQLPAGTYTITVHYWDRNSPATSTLIVAAANPTVPTLSEWAIVTLLIGISVVGILAMRT